MNLVLFNSINDLGCGILRSKSTKAYQVRKPKKTKNNFQCNKLGAVVVSSDT